MFDDKKDLLHRIAEASKSIRQKHRLLKTNKEATTKDLEEFFKPVSEPLKKISQTKNEEQVIQQPLPKLRNDFSTPRPGTSGTAAAIKKRNDYLAFINESKKSKFNNGNQSIYSDDENDDYLSFNTNETSISENSVLQEEKFDKNVSSEVPVNSSSSPLIEEYVRKVSQQDKDFDTTTGVRNLVSGLKIGDSHIKFHENSFEVQGQTYDATTGLLELLFKKKPQNYTKSDLDVYKGLVLATNVYKKGYAKSGGLRSDKSDKYQNIILNLVRKSGKGLPKYLIEHKESHDIDYIYWDDPNELVDRLRLLISSQAAGNTNHSNEIFSIIEELRESKIIY